MSEVPQPTARPPLEAIAPPRDGFAFTPSDTTLIIHPVTGKAVVAKAISIDTAGDVKVRFISGNDATIPLQAGRTSMEIDRIYDTGTTAASVFAWL